MCVEKFNLLSNVLQLFELNPEPPCTVLRVEPLS